MKIYKYPYPNRIFNNREKEKLKHLDKINKRNLQINKLITYAFVLLYFLLVGSLIVLTIWGTKLLSGAWFVLFLVLMITAIIILPPLILIGVYKCINKKIPSVTCEALKLEFIKKITAPLAEYYNIPSKYVVTKCYSSTVANVTNKDIIVFTYNGKLRIVNDIFHSTCDFGCYEFEPAELTYFNIVDDGKVKTVIKTGDCEFVLGYKAKTFICKSLK